MEEQQDEQEGHAPRPLILRKDQRKQASQEVKPGNDCTLWGVAEGAQGQCVWGHFIYAG